MLGRRGSWSNGNKRAKERNTFDHHGVNKNVFVLREEVDEGRSVLRGHSPLHVDLSHFLLLALSVVLILPMRRNKSEKRE